MPVLILFEDNSNNKNNNNKNDNTTDNHININNNNNNKKYDVDVDVIGKHFANAHTHISASKTKDLLFPPALALTLPSDSEPTQQSSNTHTSSTHTSPKPLSDIRGGKNNRKVGLLLSLSAVKGVFDGLNIAIGIAQIRLQYAFNEDSSPLMCEGCHVKPYRPYWWRDNTNTNTNTNNNTNE